MVIIIEWMIFLGWLSLYLANKADNKTYELDKWVRYNLDCINHLSERVDKLEREIKELKKNKRK